MERRMKKLEKSISKILKYMSEMQEVKKSHYELVENVNNLGAKVDEVYIDIAHKEADMQREIDSNTISLRDIISGNRDELKALLTNRLIWIIGITLTGVMIIVQYFEGLHAISIRNISTDIANISRTVDNNKMLVSTIDINLKNLARKVDEHNDFHRTNMNWKNNDLRK